MRELADAAGVTVPGLYYHFASKAELIQALYLARGYGTDGDEVEHPSPGPVATRIVEQARREFAHLVADVDFMRLMQRESVLGDDDALEVGRRLRDEWQGPLAGGARRVVRPRARRRRHDRGRVHRDLPLGTVRPVPQRPRRVTRRPHRRLRNADRTGAHGMSAPAPRSPADRVRGASHAQADHPDDDRGDVGDVPVVARRDDRRHRDADDRQGPARHRPLRLGVLRLPPLRDRVDPAVGPDGRHVRPEAHLPRRDAHLPGRLDPVRQRADHDPAHRVPCAAGPRRRLSHPRGPDDLRRSLHDGAASEGRGALLGDVRVRGHRRPAPGRLPHGQPLLALGLLREHPGRDRGRGAREDVHGRAARTPAQAQARLARGDHPARLDRRARVRARVGGTRLRVGLRPDHRLFRGQRPAARRVHRRSRSTRPSRSCPSTCSGSRRCGPRPSS